MNQQQADQFVKRLASGQKSKMDKWRTYAEKPKVDPMPRQGRAIAEGNLRGRKPKV